MHRSELRELLKSGRSHKLAPFVRPELGLLSVIGIVTPIEESITGEQIQRAYHCDKDDQTFGRNPQHRVN
jgi:hypothetical protein